MFKKIVLFLSLFVSTFCFAGKKQTIVLRVHASSQFSTKEYHTCFQTTDFFDNSHCVTNYGGPSISNTYDHGPKYWRLLHYKLDSKHYYISFKGDCAQIFNESQPTPNQNGQLVIDVDVNIIDQFPLPLLTYSNCKWVWLK